ncbi:MAG: prephenate dehydrogenase [Arcobacter butzleri]|jgi:prephenate dehydrogenase|nr:prephenate dehydrogenase [Arcobacteraceae bacterium]MDY0365743.1 prephenate dehydrogenase [Arcobacteraceae bacterium]NLO18083.1 prephenate dehydrogenase [Aliarcobacter butzleri]
MTVGIVGIGLMGGSFAKALRKYNIASDIFAYDHNINHQKIALELKLVDKICTFDELKKCDVIILSIPVDGIISISKELIDIEEHTTIIDFGSTKELIVENIPSKIRKNFVAAHPMTGTEKFGPYAAIDGLYEDKIVVLCDTFNNSSFHLHKAIGIFRQINMKIIQMDAKEHDIHACYMSHLPHAVSYALANTVMSYENPKEIITLAAGGFKDMSRIAKSSPNMWCDIFRQNRQNILDSLEIYEAKLNLLKEYLKDEDYDSIHAYMSKANTLHDILN